MGNAWRRNQQAKQAAARAEAEVKESILPQLSQLSHPQPIRPRGAYPSPRHTLMAATPHIASGITPPQFLHKPSQLSFWLNDVDGDCVTAEEAFKCACYNPEVFITDATLAAWAKPRGLLNGAFLPDVIGMMHKHGFDQDGFVYGDGQHIGVDWGDESILENAIWKGPVKIGVAADQLENAVPNPPVNGWFATGFSKDNNFDHCVSLCGFGTFAWLAEQLGVTVPSELDGSTPGYGLFTWSSIGVIDRPSLLAITGEAWLREPNMVTTPHS
jgi:hypothetical protein